MSALPRVEIRTVDGIISIAQSHAFFQPRYRFPDPPGVNVPR